MDEGQQSTPAEARTERLEAQLAAITGRVFRLEQELAALRGQPAPAAAAAMPPPVPQPVQMETRAIAPAATVAMPVEQPGVGQAKPATRPARERGSLESRVGSQWFNRIGIIALLVGVAWFLKFAFDNRWVGPAGRVLIGLISGAALIAWSERFRAKGYSAFSYSLKAVGSGVLYLSLWAAFSMYRLIPPGVAFGGMVLVTAFNAWIAWLQDAELLAVYAIVGGFSTPLLLATGYNDEAYLFSYLLMMNAATMVLLIRKGWNRLLVLSFLGTASFFWGWYLVFYKAPALETTAIFLSLFVVQFAVATILARQSRERAGQSDAARVLVSLANAASGFLGFYVMLSHLGSGRNAALAWCAVAFAAFYLAVRKLIERTPMAGVRAASLSDVQLAIAVVFLTLAVPLAVHGHWVTVGWMAEGAVLLWVATRSRTLLMRVLAEAALMLGLISLAMDASVAQTRLVWNIRLLSFAVSIAALSVAAVLSGRQARMGATDAEQWRGLAQVCATIARALVVIAVLFEIHTYWWSGPGPAAGLTDLRIPGSLLTSAMWVVVASAAILVAARWPAASRSADTRVAGWEAGCWFASGLALLIAGMFYPQREVLWNLRFAAFVVTIAGLVWLGRHLGNARAELRVSVSVLVTLLVLTAVCFEIATFWSTRSFAAAPGSAVYATQAAERQMAERFSYSAWFLLAGAGLLAAGFRRRSALLRWQALVLLAVTIFKVFLLDTSTLSQGYRIISFLALGGLLLGVSFAYQRDWLRLRAAGSGDGEKTS